MFSCVVYNFNHKYTKFIIRLYLLTMKKIIDKADLLKSIR